MTTLEFKPQFFATLKHYSKKQFTTDLLAGADVSRFDKAKKKKNKQRNPRRNDYDNRRREASGERKPKE